MFHIDMSHVSYRHESCLWHYYSFLTQRVLVLTVRLHLASVLVVAFWWQETWLMSCVYKRHDSWHWPWCWAAQTLTRDMPHDTSDSALSSRGLCHGSRTRSLAGWGRGGLPGNGGWDRRVSRVYDNVWQQLALSSMCYIRDMTHVYKRHYSCI
jgi:hypothetical protein